MSNLFDSANYAATEPTKIVAGDYLAWKRSDLNSDYSNALYTLKYSARLEGDGTKEIEITASASGTDYLIEVASTVTALYNAGVYHWQAYIIRNSDSARVTVDSGTFEVLNNSDVATADPRTTAKQMVEAIDAAMLGFAKKMQKLYILPNGMRVEYESRSELIKMREYWVGQVRREAIKEKLENGLGDPRYIGIRITRP